MMQSYVIYAPYWKPAKSRRRLLEYRGPDVFRYQALSVMLALPENIVRKYHPEISRVLYAYATAGGKYAFKYSENDWQLRFAARYVELIKNELATMKWGAQGRDPIPLMSSLNMDIGLIGFQKKTRYFRHKWLALRLDVDLTNWCLFAQAFQEQISDKFSQKSADPKFGFIKTDDSAPKPNIMEFKNSL